MKPPKVSRALLRETDVQRQVVQFFRKAGCTVYVLSQGRKTRQTPGLPDLWVMHPQHGAGWFETKMPSGKLSPAQQEFWDRCAVANVWYDHGGLERAEAFWARRMFVGKRS